MSTIISGNTPSSFGDDVSAPNLILPTAPAVGYQQGVWAPTVATGTAGAVRPYWSRIGNTVFVTALINTFSDRTSNVTVNIEGLPYAVLSGYNNAAGPLMGQYLTDGAAGGWSTYLNDSSQLLFYRTTASAWIPLQHSALNNSASSLHLCATYLTDDTTWTPINGATVS